MSRRISILTLALAGGLLVSLQSAMAQPGGGFGGGGFGGGGFGGGGGGLLGNINDPNVRKEVELLDDQYEKLQDLQRKMGESMREVFQGVDFRNMSDEDRQAFRDKMTAKRKEIEKDAEAILLPSQVERLKQIGIQSQLRGRSTADVLASSELKAELGITDAQIEEMKKAQEEAQADMRKKLEKIQEDAREKVLAVLTPEQRAKVKKLMGAKIEFSPPQFGGFGGRGQGGPGGQGGQGGRGRGRGNDQGN